MNLGAAGYAFEKRLSNFRVAHRSKGSFECGRVAEYEPPLTRREARRCAVHLGPVGALHKVSFVFDLEVLVVRRHYRGRSDCMVGRNSEIGEHLVHVNEFVFDDGAELLAVVAAASTRGDHYRDV